MADWDIYEGDKKILWFMCGGICAICKTSIVPINSSGDRYVIGQMAHIYGEKPTAARYLASIEESFVRSYKNHLALCGTCHSKIDKNEKDYPIDLLLKIKSEHEDEVMDKLKSNIGNVTFVELEVVIRFLQEQPVDNQNLALITPSEKIKRNQLSEKVDTLLKIGLIQRHQVAEYLNKNPDVNFSERLRAGFIKQYQELKQKGESKDELFYSLFEFASNNSSDFKIKAAGLAVLTYFFEICDIFEI